MKHSLLLLAMLGSLSAPAFASDALKCQPAELKVSALTQSAKTGYKVVCNLPLAGSAAPVLTFEGDLPAGSTPSHIIKASFTIDGRDASARHLGKEPREDQVQTGTLRSASESLAALPMQFDSQTVWDEKTKSVSIEVRPGTWRVYTFLARQDPALAQALAPGETLVTEVEVDTSVSYAGEASAPLKAGRTVLKLVLDSEYSRFAGKKADTPIVSAEMGLRDGKLEFLLGESRVTNQKAVLAALHALDKKPANVMLAWSLASRAKVLGLTDEVSYAEQKVAAHNPHLLREFQDSLSRIKPYVAAQ